jgi:hypothetical protein
MYFSEIDIALFWVPRTVLRQQPNGDIWTLSQQDAYPSK